MSMNQQCWKKRILPLAGKVLIILIVTAICCKLYVLDIYRVKGGSMEGSLHDGQLLLINKLAAGADIRTGDILIYELFDNFFVVKRCAGRPGDVVRLKHDSVYINDHFLSFPGRAIGRYRIYFTNKASVQGFLEKIPAKRIISMDPVHRMIVADLEESETQDLLLQSHIRLTRLCHSLIEGKHIYFFPGKWTINSMGPVKVPQQQYFMLGDNGMVSEDSRYLGFVRQEQIIGKVIGNY